MRYLLKLSKAYINFICYSGIYEVQMFWGITTLFVVHRSSQIRYIVRHNKRHFMSTILFFIINIWVIILAMLHQPYNVILLPTQIIMSSTIDTILKINNFPKLNVFVHYWLGNVFYFYQVFIYLNNIIN